MSVTKYCLGQCIVEMLAAEHLPVQTCGGFNCAVDDDYMWRLVLHLVHVYYCMDEDLVGMILHTVERHILASPGLARCMHRSAGQ